MRKKIVLIIVLVVVNALLLIPAIYAYMFKRVSTLENTFEVADIFATDSEPIIETIQNLTMDGKPVTVKQSVHVDNTGNIPEYLRVKLITHWEDSKGNVVGIASEKLDFKTTDDWIYDETNDVYYYKKVVYPNDDPVRFLAEDSQIIMRHIEKKVELTATEYVIYDYYQVVEIHVEGIQALGDTGEVGVLPVEKVWGVTVDNNGVITSVNK